MAIENKASNITDEEFEKIPTTKNILAGQEGPIRRPIFEGEFGEVQKFKGYEILDVRVKSVYCKEDALWVKFDRIDGRDGFSVRIDNAYQQFKNTKSMTQDEIDRAEWMKARNKLDSPEFVQKLIHQGKDINALMEVAGYTAERFNQISKTSNKKEELTLNDLGNTASFNNENSLKNEKKQEQGMSL